MRRKRCSSRRLLFDALESRQLMAADFHFGHNFISPEDTDGSGIVSPIDALRVINAINSSTKQSNDLLDVTADDVLSPIDALVVINTLNQQSSSQSIVASGVAAAARIARIEAALTAGSSGNLTPAEAEVVLETLALGGAPELGDCSTNDDSSTALERLATRLTDLGVDSAVVDTVVAAIQEQLDAGEATYRDIVQSVLEENGIDIKALLQQKRGEEQIARLTVRLTELGVDQTVIDSLETELTDALKAGTPYTHDQLVDRLTELGIDVDEVFQRPDRPSDNPGRDTVSADEVADRLDKMGVDSTIIDTIVSEITAAAEAGTPWTRADLLARLTELGIMVRRVGGPGRR